MNSKYYYAIRRLNRLNNNIDSNLENDYNNFTKYTSYYSNYKDTFENLTIKLNSMTLLEEKSADYYRIVQSQLYHNHIRNKYIYSYSFSLNPNEYQPSGAMNFSDLNNALFLFKFKPPSVVISFLFSGTMQI